jgi:hypothetical protein
MAVSSGGLRQLWQSPEAIVQVNYRPILSSDRVPHIKKPAVVREIKEIRSWDPDGIPTPRQTGRLTVGRKLTTSTSKRCDIRLKGKTVRTSEVHFPRQYRGVRDPTSTTIDMSLLQLNS